MKKLSLRVGSAESEFTPAPGLFLLGQMHQRVAKHKRDPLTANAIAFRQGKQTVVIVSIDICVLPDFFIRNIQNLFAEKTKLPAANLILHSTHTHVAPSVNDLIVSPPDPKFVKNLEKQILDAAVRAVQNLEPAEVFSGTGHMEQMGWNRRAMYKDGSSRMYGNSTDKGFVGLEGPRDPALPVLFTRDAKGKVKTILVNFASHPNCCEGECFYSADLPGEVRKQLKATFGDDVTVVYLTGAAGNTAPSILNPFDKTHPWRSESGLVRSGLYLAAEASRTIAATIKPIAKPTLQFHQSTLMIPLRPWPKPGAPNDPEPNNRKWKASIRYYLAAKADWPRMQTEENPVPVNVNMIRIGDTAICTNPAELFVEFGLAIRKKSPARVTFVAELADGYVGYVPTRKAMSRGGYETWPAPSSKLSVEAGDQIVNATAKMLKKSFTK